MALGSPTDSLTFPWLIISFTDLNVMGAPSSLLDCKGMSTLPSTFHLSIIVVFRSVDVLMLITLIFKVADPRRILDAAID